MEFKILGPLEITTGSRRLELGGVRRQITVATLLLGVNKIVTVDRLLEAIYGESMPMTSRSQIQIIVSSLRHMFASAGYPGVIDTHPNGYGLRIDGSLLDAQQFEELVVTARAAENPEEAIAKYRDAHRLWRGPALEGLDSQVLQVAASRLNELRIGVAEDRFHLELGLGRHHELVGELTELVEGHPLRERLCGQLMLALHNCGRTAEALRVYQNVRHTLADELGLEPGEQLQRLHSAVLRPDPALAPLNAARWSPPVEPRPPRLLPTDVGDFTGRAEQIRRIQRHLASAHRGGLRSAAPLVVVVGTGGVGKTAVAVHTSHLLADHFPDGQLFVDLHGSSGRPVGPTEVLERFIRALGSPSSRISASLDERAETYRDLLAGRRVLILLDDAANERQVRPLLPGDSAAAVLITSRRRLTALPDAAQVDVRTFDIGTSLEMLGRIAGRPRVRGHLRAAVSVAERCGHLPLALRIAGARLSARPDWSTELLADRLADETGRLDELRYRDLCVRTSFSPTYESVGEQARRLFRRLAVLDAPSFAGWAGAALLDQPIDHAERVLDDLVDARLVEVDSVWPDEPDQHRLPVLTRVFARERLAAEEPAAQRRTALKRALGALLCLAEHARVNLNGEDNLVAADATLWWPLPPAVVTRTVSDPVAWCDREQATLATGVRQAAEAGLGELCWRLALSVAPLLDALPGTPHVRELQRIASAAAGMAPAVPLHAPTPT